MSEKVKLVTKNGAEFEYTTRLITVPKAKSVSAFNESIGLGFLEPLSKTQTLEERRDIILGYIKRDLTLSVKAGNITEEKARQNYEYFLRNPLDSEWWSNRGTFDERLLIEEVAEDHSGYLIRQTEENIESELTSFDGILKKSNNPETTRLFEQLGDLPLFASIYIDKDAAHSVVPRVPMDITNKVIVCVTACDEVEEFYNKNGIQIPGLQVIEINGKPAGFGGWTLYVDDKQPHLIETNLAFLKQHRSNGYASAISAHSMNDAIGQINGKTVNEKPIELYTDCKQENYRSFLAANNGGFYPIQVTGWARDPNIKVIQMKFDVEKYLENPAEYSNVVKQQTTEFMKQNPEIAQFYLQNAQRDLTACSAELQGKVAVATMPMKS